MTFTESLMLYFSTVVSALLLIAGGWVKIRDWVEAHAEAKAEAAAKAKADEIEAAVQERLKKCRLKTNQRQMQRQTAPLVLLPCNGITAGIH